MLLLLDVVNDKEDVVVFPRFVGNVCLQTNSGKMSLKMSSWKCFGESICWVVSVQKHDEEQAAQPNANPESQKAKLYMFCSFVDPHALDQAWC